MDLSMETVDVVLIDNPTMSVEEEEKSRKECVLLERENAILRLRLKEATDQRDEARVDRNSVCVMYNEVTNENRELMRRLEHAKACADTTKLDFKRMDLKHRQRSAQLAKARLELMDLKDQLSKVPSFDEERELWRARCVELKDTANAMLDEQYFVWSTSYAKLYKSFASRVPLIANGLEEQAASGMVELEDTDPSRTVMMIPIKPIPKNTAPEYDSTKRPANRRFLRSSGYVPLDYHELEDIRVALAPKRRRH